MKFSSAIIISLCVAVLLGFQSSHSWAREKSFSMAQEVKAASWLGSRLRGLPQNGTLRVALSIDGPIDVMLLSEESYQSFPEKYQALFEGQTSDTLEFSLILPTSGTYYLLLDNRAGNKLRKGKIKVTAATADATSAAPRATGGPDESLPSSKKLEASLRKWFVFDQITYQVSRCGVANSFSKSNTVILCAEYSQKLVEELGDVEKARAALVFTVLHEIGHVMLAQWELPFHDNEEVADEFATVMLMMLDEQEAVRHQAEYFASLDEESEFRKKLGRDDRHPLSVQRARNILKWVDDPLLPRKWQALLVPHMQTAFLQQQMKAPLAWSNLVLIERELAVRN